MTLWLGHFPIQAIWETAKWNGIHPAFLMENPKSIDVSLWNRRGPWVPSCGWRAYPNNPEQIACFSAAQLLTLFQQGEKNNTDRHIGVDNKTKKARRVMKGERNNVWVFVFTPVRKEEERNPDLWAQRKKSGPFFSRRRLWQQGSLKTHQPPATPRTQFMLSKHFAGEDTTEREAVSEFDKLKRWNESNRRVK